VEVAANSIAASRNAAFAQVQFQQVQLMFLHPIPLDYIATLHELSFDRRRSARLYAKKGMLI